jgi:hypothetical protein
MQIFFWALVHFIQRSLLHSLGRRCNLIGSTGLLQFIYFRKQHGDNEGNGSKHECVLAQIVRRMYEQETNSIHILTRW